MGTPLRVSRFECKYYIAPELVPEIKAAIAPYVDRDPFAARNVEGNYPILSLYLDTRDLQLCQASLQGLRNRFKLRVRSYTNQPDDPVYFEIKRRIDGIVSKRRGRVPREAARVALERLSFPQGTLEDKDRPAAEEFLSLVAGLRLQPVTRVGYERESFEAITGEPVRITFDTGLRHAATQDWDFWVEPRDWKIVPLDRQILELKFTDQLPSWAERIVAQFQLQRRSICKYVIAVRDGSGNPLGEPALTPILE